MNYLHSRNNRAYKSTPKSYVYYPHIIQIDSHIVHSFDIQHINQMLFCRLSQGKNEKKALYLHPIRIHNLKILGNNASNTVQFHTILCVSVLVHHLSDTLQK